MVEVTYEQLPGYFLDKHEVGFSLYSDDGGVVFHSSCTNIPAEATLQEVHDIMFPILVKP